MTPDAYAAFTERLVTSLSGDPDVLGIVLVGSTSGHGAGPDASSDHDFFVVTHPGAQERFRRDLQWLPDAKDLVLQFRETAHGVKALYASGHLVEFAAFDPEELALARINRYRVALDRADITARTAAVRVATSEATAAAPDLAHHAGQLATNLVVGVARAARGERLSGHHFVRSSALGHLVTLLRVQHGDDEWRDNLDPLRRFERSFPAIGSELDAALQLPIAECAHRLLGIARRELPDALSAAAYASIERYIVDAVASGAARTSP